MISYSSTLGAVSMHCIVTVLGSPTAGMAAHSALLLDTLQHGFSLLQKIVDLLENAQLDSLDSGYIGKFTEFLRIFVKT